MKSQSWILHDFEVPAVEELSKELWWKEEQLDPSPDVKTWETLSNHEREFYRCCIVHILGKRKLLESALSTALEEKP